MLLQIHRPVFDASGRWLVTGGGGAGGRLALFDADTGELRARSRLPSGGDEDTALAVSGAAAPRGGGGGGDGLVAAACGNRGSPSLLSLGWW